MAEIAHGIQRSIGLSLEDIFLRIITEEEHGGVEHEGELVEA